MNKKHIALIQGHPDPQTTHFGHALAAAYAQGAEQAGHAVKIVTVAQLDFPLLRTKADFETGTPPPDIQAAQEVIRWADHLVILYPLWLGGMPALLKGFFEQVFRPALTTGDGKTGPGAPQLLKGKSARIVVTMGMPAPIYRWFFGAHSLKSLERNVLGFVGIGPIKETLIGLVEAPDARPRTAWLAKLQALGKAGA